MFKLCLTSISISSCIHKSQLVLYMNIFTFDIHICSFLYSQKPISVVHEYIHIHVLSSKCSSDVNLFRDNNACSAFDSFWLCFFLSNMWKPYAVENVETWFRFHFIMGSKHFNLAFESKRYFVYSNALSVIDEDYQRTQFQSWDFNWRFRFTLSL